MGIVITGIGVVVPEANNVDELEGLMRGGVCATRGTATPYWRFGPAGTCCHPPSRPHKIRNRGTVAGDLACYAANQAMGGDIPGAIICGISEHGATYTQQECHDYLQNGTTPVSHLYLQRNIANAPAGEVAQHLGCTGIVRTVSTACASGISAIIDGCEMILSGRANVVLAGGVSEATNSYGSFSGFSALGALAKDKARPFDTGRDGIVVSDGACFLRLEREYETTRPIIARILGWAETCDASHPTTSTGPHLKRAYEQATAGFDIAGTICHATGTVAGDEIELSQIPGRVTSIKGAIGHTMGAAGAVNVAVAAHGLLPACVGCDNPISDRVIMETIRTDEPIACTAIGMWGQNAVMVVQCGI